MPREDSIAETAKQRSLRVTLDHYRRPNRLMRVKFGLTLLATVIAIVYSAWLAMPTPAARQQVSPGPLAAVHATWNNDCAACHLDFQPLRSDAVGLVGLFRGQSDQRQSLDQACLKCHNTAVHHAAAKGEDVPSCAACHHDHQGPTADIVRASDASCLGCHREIAGHRNGESALRPDVPNVTGFAKGSGEGIGAHPEFRSFQDDPGNIKFNHWLHMQPGIAVKDAKKKFALDQVTESSRKQYERVVGKDGLVQLDCVACHEPDATGATMQPIAFERHCQACHPLSLKLAENQPAAKVPHGLPVDRLSAVVDGLLFAAERQQAGSPPATADESGKSPLIPGRTLGDNLAQKISRDVLGRRNTALRAMSLQCLECHVAAASGEGSAAELPTLLPANVPQTWFRHAKFDHGAHRHVECRACHAEAFAFEQRDKPQHISPAANASAAGGDLARDNELVMIAGLESCVKCHAPAQGNIGGARFDCAECHKYHGGDHHIGEVSLSQTTRVKSKPLSTVFASVQAKPILQLVSFKGPADNKPAFVGTASCVSAGCHGDPREDSPKWRTAFTTWASRGPHSQAYDVLWTQRGREMTRLLSGHTEPLTDAAHSQALEQRCVGCHATPPPANASLKAVHYALGVQCESCHGPAEHWLHSHSQAGFRRDTSGFIDTKEQLRQRANACVQCHVGPSDASGAPQAVDHDLIAAGHPRLAFEFNAYMQSLPAHWDQAKDEKRLPLSFHFESWLAGQKARAEWEQAHADSQSTDFAKYECSVCHHGLAGNSWRQQGGLQFLPVKASLPIPDQTRFSGRQKLALIRHLLAAGAQHKSWEVANEAYLAATAITADQPMRGWTDWDSVLGKLGSYLGRDCFPAVIRDRRAPTIYDSPSEFDPAVWHKLIQPAMQHVRQLEADSVK